MKFKGIKAYIEIFINALKRGQFRYAFIILHVVIFRRKSRRIKRENRNDLDMEISIDDFDKALQYLSDNLF